MDVEGMDWEEARHRPRAGAILPGTEALCLYDRDK